MAKATFAAGSSERFEQIIARMQGVTGTRVGYVGAENGPADLRAIEVRFDPHLLKFTDLVEAFWRAHECASVPGDAERGEEARRAVIFYHDSDQRSEAVAARIRLERDERFHGKLTAEILPAPPLLEPRPAPASTASRLSRRDLPRDNT